MKLYEQFPQRYGNHYRKETFSAAFSPDDDALAKEQNISDDDLVLMLLTDAQKWDKADVADREDITAKMEATWSVGRLQLPVRICRVS